MSNVSPNCEIERERHQQRNRERRMKQIKGDRERYRSTHCKWACGVWNTTSQHSYSLCLLMMSVCLCVWHHSSWTRSTVTSAGSGTAYVLMISSTNQLSGRHCPVGNSNESHKNVFISETQEIKALTRYVSNENSILVAFSRNITSSSWQHRISHLFIRLL